MAEVRISVKVHPGASRNEVVSFEDGLLKVKVAAPPEKGKANAELVVFLAKSLGLGRTQVSIVSRGMSREKVLSFTGIASADLEERLSALCQKQRKLL